MSALRPGTARAGEPLLLGVHPYLPATEVLKKFQPLAAYLGGQLGRSVRVDVSRDYEEHIRRVGGGEVHFAYLGPASYVKLAATYGRPFLLARLEIRGKPTFAGHIIVLEDSPFQTLEDLKGARFAFASAASTMGNLVPRYMLQREGIALEELGAYSFLTNHENVAIGVLAGDFDAGAVKEETFVMYRAEGLRSLATTPAISEHLFVATDAMPPGEADRLRTVLLQAGESEDGSRALRAIKGTVSALVPAADGDYEVLRTILGEVEEVPTAP